VKILLTGMNGQLGFELQKTIGSLGSVKMVGASDCNFNDKQGLRRLIQDSSPDVIINAGAYTQVDKAEDESELSYSINADALEIIGEESKRLGALVIHYSTDYIFDGEKETPYTELDTPNPQNIYGKSKLQGELNLINSNQNHHIFRNSWVVGSHGTNFLKTILRLAKDKQEISVVSDQFGTPTSALLIAQITSRVVNLYNSMRSEDFPNGIFNLTPKGRVSWYEFACFIVKEALSLGEDFRLSSANILAINSSDYPTKAKRPLNSSLDSSLFYDTFNIELPFWEEGIILVMNELLIKK